MILLDTHVWLWWLSDPKQLSRKAREAIDEAVTKDGLLISSISAWEIALLVAKGRLRLRMAASDWVARSESLPFVSFVPVDNAIATRSVALPDPLHDDPADRIIVATSLVFGLALVTKDRRLLDYEHAKTLW